MSVLLVGFIVFLVCDICIPKNVNNTVEQTVTFISCDVKEDEVILTSADDNIYKIQYAAEQININGIKSICNGKSKVTTYSKEVTPDDEEDFYSIKAIKYNDSYLLSFEEESNGQPLPGQPPAPQDRSVLQAYYCPGHFSAPGDRWSDPHKGR